MEEYPEQDEEYLDTYEDQRDAQEDTEPTWEAPISYQGKDDIWSLFLKIIRMKDSSKFGNLDTEELGTMEFPVRPCQFVSLLADTLGHNQFGKFFYGIGEISLATSLSKEGFLQNTFITRKEEKTRTKSHRMQISSQPGKSKKGFLKGP